MLGFPPPKRSRMSGQLNARAMNQLWISVSHAVGPPPVGWTPSSLFQGTGSWPGTIGEFGLIWSDCLDIVCC